MIVSMADPHQSPMGKLTNPFSGSRSESARALLHLRSSLSHPFYVALSALCMGWTFSPNTSSPLRPIQCPFPSHIQLVQVTHNTLLPCLHRPTLPPPSHSRINLIHSADRTPILVVLALLMAKPYQSATSIDDRSKSRLLLSSVEG